MFRIYTLMLLVMVLLGWSCTAGRVGAAASIEVLQGGASSSGELRFKAPQTWVNEKPSSNMRVAQYTLPRADGDTQDANLVLYFFGSSQGGSAADNVDRWISQIEQPDGGPSKDKAKVETLTVNGLKVTTVDLSGTYTAQMSPGSEARHNDKGQRLRAAVIETPKGNYFVKLIGPEKTVGRWNQSFNDYLNSFEFK
jgi:hypothetical protein